jgi:hypothetical protein
MFLIPQTEEEGEGELVKRVGNLLPLLDFGRLCEGWLWRLWSDE